MKTLLYTLALLSIASVLAANVIPGTSLTPDLWLTDATTNFDGTTWNATVGPNAVPFGVRAEVGSDKPAATYGAPTLTSYTATTGPYAGRTLGGVLFAGNADDLLVVAGLGSNPSSATTIFAIYQVGTGATSYSEIRPVGFGSQASQVATSPGVFNLAADGSLRYDNGNNQSGLTDGFELLYRASVLSNDTVSDYLNGSIRIDGATTGGSFDDIQHGDFFIGDVRAGATRVSGADPGTFGLADIFVAEVIVFNRALSPQEIADVNAYLALAVIPEPSTWALLLASAVVLVAARRMRRR